MIPDLHRQIGSVTTDWNDMLRVLVRLLFDPTEYVWKWIIGLLTAVVMLLKKWLLTSIVDRRFEPAEPRQHLKVD